MFKSLFKKFILTQRFTNLFAIALVVSLFVGAEQTFAAEDSYQDFLQIWGRVISLIGSLINVVIWIVIKFIGDLLTNDFIFGAGIEDMLKSIWQTVRNFVNIAFVFVLLVIAFYNIVAIDPEKIPLKKSLGKVALALILVNFSYFAAKVVLDVANVLTTAVFAIPRDIITDLELSTADNEYGEKAIHAQCYKKFYQGAEVDLATMEYDALPDEVTGSAWRTDASGSYLLMPTKCHIPNIVKVKLFKEGTEVADSSVISANYDEMKVYLYYQEYNEQGEPVGPQLDVDYDPTMGGSGYKDPATFNSELQKAELSAKKFGRHTITMILAKTMFDLNKLTSVSAASSSGVLGLTVGGIVNLLLLIIYGTMFVAMFVVLIFRVVYLWVCIAFSPLVALMFVFKDFGLEMGEFDIAKMFIKYAFVPVKMGIALSVGVLMLFKANQQSILQDTVTTLGEKAADIQIPIDTLVSDSSIQKIMWNIATVAVVWIAIKWSLKDLSGPVQGIVDKITGYVGSVGEIAAKIPLTLPIAPYTNLSEGGERQTKTVGQIFNSISAANLNAIQRDRILGIDRDTAKLNRGIEYELDRVTGPNQREELQNITMNDQKMTQVMQENNVNMRNKLAEKLGIMGALGPEQLKDWRDGTDKSASKFRELLRNSSQQDTFFKGKDFKNDWQAGGKSTLAAKPASQSALFNPDTANFNEWSDVASKAELTAKKKAIDESIASVNEPAAQAALRSNLQLAVDGDKYSAAKTEETLKNAVSALTEARGKTEADRKTIRDNLEDEVLALYDKAIGSIAGPKSSTETPTPKEGST